MHSPTAIPAGRFNGYLPGPAALDTDLEHLEILHEAEYAIFADKHNWKYAWFGEHHGLTEYTHLSAPEVVMGYVAAKTDYIHLSTGITSTWRDEHPGTGPWLTDILGVLEERPEHVPVALRRERVIAIIMLMTAALAERARTIESGRPPELDEPHFRGQPHRHARRHLGGGRSGSRGDPLDLTIVPPCTWWGNREERPRPAAQLHPRGAGRHRTPARP